ncbi:hypothetical protein HD553DRAFT_342544 [Filobasidium floriforme]|uniref:uncharacterized protein n=1 Tax=Filobasidium floriforme TaxID=5210 RepID=UPI001E8E21A9|nr:uncharacterized protein HD553DRAFT_342544 [Filobasidium floriforme]KAH8084150.1 hypothetical protein HD553DRAFT_342544 [Filobasidium floriforme]
METVVVKAEPRSPGIGPEYNNHPDSPITVLSDDEGDDDFVVAYQEERGSQGEMGAEVGWEGWGDRDDDMEDEEDQEDEQLAITTTNSKRQRLEAKDEPLATTVKRPRLELPHGGLPRLEVPHGGLLRWEGKKKCVRCFNNSDSHPPFICESQVRKGRAFGGCLELEGDKLEGLEPGGDKLEGLEPGGDKLEGHELERDETIRLFEHESLEHEEFLGTHNKTTRILETDTIESDTGSLQGHQAADTEQFRVLRRKSLMGDRS